MIAEEIRADFKTAFEHVDNGTELSSILGWGFSTEDIKNLAGIHKNNPEYREKIEDLLTDCNFHTEADNFQNGNYEEYIDEKERSMELDR